MSIDKKIKQELESEAERDDSIINDNQGMFNLAIAPFKGGLGKWMVLVNIIILIVTAFMVWVGFMFFSSNDIDGRIFWGVWFVVAVIAQVGLKQWTWMEIHRNSLLREIKRVEISVERLIAKVEKT